LWIPRRDLHRVADRVDGVQRLAASLQAMAHTKPESSRAMATTALVEHASGAQPAEARAQPHLGFPGDRARVLGTFALALGDG
jgi:hypothetical protein